MRNKKAAVLSMLAMAAMAQEGMGHTMEMPDLIQNGTRKKPALIKKQQKARAKSKKAKKARKKK